MRLTLEAVCTMIGEKDIDWKAIRRRMKKDDFISTILKFKTAKMKPGQRKKVRAGPGAAGQPGARSCKVACHAVTHTCTALGCSSTTGAGAAGQPEAQLREREPWEQGRGAAGWTKALRCAPQFWRQLLRESQLT